VIGQLEDLMLGNIFTTKYTDLGSHIVDFYINNICNPNTLIDLWASINVMMSENVEKLNLTYL
jgi:hypothetical protein